MSGSKKVVAFIPVRGGSKSIILKNIMPLAGKPLVYWTIEAALKCSFIDHVYAATNSAEIAECVNKISSNRLSAIGRSPHTATDTASSESALLEFCNNYDFEYVFFIQATSPLLKSEDLEGAWNKFRENSFDSLISAVNKKQFVWQENQDKIASPMNYDPLNRPRRQDWDGYFVENGAFYLSSRKNILNSGCRISGKTGIYKMADESCFEIDEPSDWIIIENLLLNRMKAGVSSEY